MRGLFPMNRSQRLGATAAATAALLGGAGVALAATRADAEPAAEPASATAGMSAPRTAGMSAAERALADLDAETAELAAEAEALRSEISACLPGRGRRARDEDRSRRGRGLPRRGHLGQSVRRGSSRLR